MNENKSHILIIDKGNERAELNHFILSDQAFLTFCVEREECVKLYGVLSVSTDYLDSCGFFNCEYNDENLQKIFSVLTGYKEEVEDNFANTEETGFPDWYDKHPASEQTKKKIVPKAYGKFTYNDQDFRENNLVLEELEGLDYLRLNSEDIRIAVESLISSYSFEFLVYTRRDNITIGYERNGIIVIIEEDLTGETTGKVIRYIKDKKTIHDKYVEAIKTEEFEKAGKLITRQAFRLATKAEHGNEVTAEELREHAEDLLSYRKWSDERVKVGPMEDGLTFEHIGGLSPMMYKIKRLSVIEGLQQKIDSLKFAVKYLNEDAVVEAIRNVLK